MMKKSDNNREMSRNYVVNLMSYTNGNHVRPRIRIYRSWVPKIPNLKSIQGNCESKHFSKSYFQCDIGTDSPGSSKPSAEFKHEINLC